MNQANQPHPEEFAKSKFKERKGREGAAVGPRQYTNHMNAVLKAIFNFNSLLFTGATRVFISMA